jgi:hypothetical protein
MVTPPVCSPARVPDHALAGDKYNDNHFAADLQISGDSIVTYMNAHNPYPISATTSWWAYACAQSYLIDPTGTLGRIHIHPALLCTHAHTHSLALPSPRRLDHPD